MFPVFEECKKKDNGAGMTKIAPSAMQSRQKDEDAVTAGDVRVRDNEGYLPSTWDSG